MRLADADQSSEALSLVSSASLYTRAVETNGKPGRRRLKLVITLAIVAGLAGGVVWVMRYRPLEQGSTAQRPAGSIEVKDSFAGIDDPQKVRVPYHDGDENSFAFSVRNTGRWGVSITGLPDLRPRNDFVIFRITKAEISDAPGAGAFRSFRPFSLAAGDEMLIRLTGTLTNCEWYQPPGGSVFASVAIQYRFLWSTHTANIPLPFEVEIDSPPAEQCPREPKYN